MKSRMELPGAQERYATYDEQEPRPYYYSAAQKAHMAKVQEWHNAGRPYESKEVTASEAFARWEAER